MKFQPILLFPLTIGVLVTLDGSPRLARELSFEERVNAQRAIEQVY